MMRPSVEFERPPISRMLLPACAIGVLALSACGDRARLAHNADAGTQPIIAAPNTGLLPTVNVAPASRWEAGSSPQPANGLTVHAMAAGLNHPRWLHVLPNGDVLVAETNAPAPRDGGGGLRGWVMRLLMKRAGSAGVSADRITLLRDVDGDGIAELKSVLLTNLHSPFGMALVGNNLYVANTDRIVRFPYVHDATRINDGGTVVAVLPATPPNYHWTRNLIAHPDGSRLYVTVGSNSNIGEHGMEHEVDRAAILEVDLATGTRRVFASGLRNPNGLAWNPRNGTLWTVVNERDELGSDLVPDYLTSVRDGGFYGWPCCYFGTHVDARVQPQRPDLVARALRPDYALGAHVAPLGLAFNTGALLSGPFREGVFIAEHGSWNRRPLSGYKVVFVAFRAGRPVGLPQDVLTEFLDGDGRARGRPAGVAIDRTGALLVADDVGNVVWRVTPAAMR